jgi:hypothetical protein
MFTVPPQQGKPKSAEDRAKTHFGRGNENDATGRAKPRWEEPQKIQKAQQIVPEMGKDWSELSEGYEGEGGLLRAT